MKWMAAGAALAAGIALWPCDQAETGAAANLANQVWIDKVPASDRDLITHMLLLDHPRARHLGVVGRSSQWRHNLELMRWSREGKKLELLFPQDRHRARLKVRTWECAGEAPSPFELCMELSSGDRKMTLYSRHEWVVEPHSEDALAESVDALRAEYPALSALDLPTLDAVGDRDEDEDEDANEVDFFDLVD